MILWIVIVVAVIVAWIWGGRYVSLGLDHVVTGRAVSQPIQPFVYGGAGFDIGGKLMSFGQLNNQQPDLPVTLDASQRVVLTCGDKSIVLGPLTKPTPNGRPDYFFQGEPGDEVLFTASKSILPWATPLDINWLGGSAPWAKRYVYYRLRWKKPSGARLEMLWRYEQQFYSDQGWTEPQMMWNSQTGLLRVEIHGS